MNCPRCDGLLRSIRDGFGDDAECLICGAMLYGKERALPTVAIPSKRGKRREPGHIKVFV